MKETSTTDVTTTKNSTLHEKLITIQQELAVPKLRENDFGGFKYRSVEDIEEVVKPFLKLYGLSFIFYDEMVAVGGRVYVRATAELYDGKDKVRGIAYAREAEKPKAKTDDAQLTGGCSSYARKYAAQGLFLIDDGNSDPDNPNQKDAAIEGETQLRVKKQEVLKALTSNKIVKGSEVMDYIEDIIGKRVIETIEEAERIIASFDEPEPKKLDKVIFVTDDYIDKIKKEELL